MENETINIIGRGFYVETCLYCGGSGWRKSHFAKYCCAECQKDALLVGQGLQPKFSGKEKKYGE